MSARSPSSNKRYSGAGNPMIYLAGRIMNGITGLVPLRVQKVIFGLLLGAYTILGLCRFFERPFFGFDPRRPHAIVTLTGFVFLLIFGRGLFKDAMERDTKRKRRQVEYEKNYVRDPEVESKIRSDIGMSPKDSSERSHGP